MNIASLAARMLLGVIFTMSGISGFFIKTPPAMPGLAGDFQNVFFATHWVLYVDAIQLLCGLALIFNRYVPLALVALAAMIYNMFVFHITMQISFVFAPAVMLLLWVLAALPHRAAFAPLFAEKSP
jgi:uncharacterized membrane protein YphA (DoxX/SURF4 family)